MQAHPRHVRRREFQDRWYGRAFIVLVALAVLGTLANRVFSNLAAGF
jgi:hypothetical protein